MPEALALSKPKELKETQLLKKTTPLTRFFLRLVGTDYQHSKMFIEQYLDHKEEDLKKLPYATLCRLNKELKIFLNKNGVSTDLATSAYLNRLNLGAHFVRSSLILHAPYNFSTAMLEAETIRAWIMLRQARRLFKIN
ncbi:MAG: hypothetical protein AB1468_01630 [Candidatus Micrarchaeota archaeon]